VIQITRYYESIPID